MALKVMGMVLAKDGASVQLQFLAPPTMQELTLFWTALNSFWGASEDELKEYAARPRPAGVITVRGTGPHGDNKNPTRQ